MADNPVTMTVDKNVVQEIVLAKIKAEVVAALSTAKDDLISKVVHQVMLAKVDDSGNPPRYSSDGNQTYLDHLIKSEFKAMARDILRAFVQENRPALEKRVRDAMKRSTDTFVKAYFHSLEAKFGENYSVKVDVELKRPQY